MTRKSSGPRRRSKPRPFVEEGFPHGFRNPVPKASYDLVILGAGPAGLAAARTAVGLGRTVALVERHCLGGVSLTTGSVPSKALVRTGRAFEAFINSEEFGAPAVPEPAADMDAVKARIRRIRARISRMCAPERLIAAGIDVFFGDASFAGNSLVTTGSLELNFRKALIATGARPRTCDIAGLDAAGYRTSEDIFDLESLPKRLAVIGGGPLGCEMAQAFAHLGSEVTILQNAPKFLPKEEREAAELLSLALARSGVSIRLNTSITKISRQIDGKRIDATSTGDAYSLTVDEILLSIGRTPNTEGLQLAEAAIACDSNGGVRVDDFFATSNPAIYAAGDVCSTRKYTNMAEASGRIVVLNAFDDAHSRRSEMVVPWCTYCDPEIAHVGMHIREAIEQSIPVKSFTVMMQDVDRAITDGRDQGFVKLHVREGTEEIIGATIVASRASEMINEISLVMTAKIGIRRLAGVLHTYPAQSDAIRLAAQAYLNSIRA